MAEGLDMVFESENEQRRPGRCDGAYGQPHETVDALSFNVEKGETLCGTCQAERNLPSRAERNMAGNDRGGELRPDLRSRERGKP